MANERRIPRRVRGPNRAKVYNGLRDCLEDMGISRKTYQLALSAGIELKMLKSGRSYVIDGNDAADFFIRLAHWKEDQKRQPVST